MNFFTFTKLGRTLLLATVVAVGSVCWLGCGGDDNPSGGEDDGGKNNGGGNLDSKLVCADGEAWMNKDGDGAWIFKSNGDMKAYGKYGASWEVDESGTWKTSGNTLTLTSGNGKVEATYSVSGTQLTLSQCGGCVEGTLTYTKTSGVNFGGNNNNGGGSNTFTDSRDKKTYKTVKIGEQTWMAQNLNYQTASGSQCYSSSPDSCAKYGRLYTWNAATTACPTGWHLPDTYDWRELWLTAGDDSGKKLKSTSGWTNKSDGSSGNGTDDFGFSALPRNGSDGKYDQWWTAREYAENVAFYLGMRYSSDYVDAGWWHIAKGWEYKTNENSVRCVKDGGNDNGGGSSNTFTDSRDNTKYKTVKIGTQTWMAENLNYQTAEYGSWCQDDQPDFCTKTKYGRLYTWAAAKTACPTGWRLPTNQEWGDLVTAAGGKDVAGKKLKSKGGWYGGGGTDDFGFSALPGGYHFSNYNFNDDGFRGLWWTLTETSKGYRAYSRQISYEYDNVFENDESDEKDGFSVRCVKNN